MMKKIFTFITLFFLIIIFSLEEKIVFETKVDSIKIEYKTYIPIILNQQEIGKFGLAVADWHHPEDAEFLNVNWVYDWHSKPAGIYGVPYVPMLWSGNISTNIPREYKNYSHVLGWLRFKGN